MRIDDIKRENRYLRLTPQRQSAGMSASRCISLSHIVRVGISLWMVNRHLSGRTAEHMCNGKRMVAR